MLHQTTQKDPRADIYHMIGTVKTSQEKCKEAIEFYRKSLEIYQKTLPQNHPHLATSYNNIGGCIST
jgi:hypothetical protein